MRTACVTQKFSNACLVCVEETRDVYTNSMQKNIMEGNSWENWWEDNIIKADLKVTESKSAYWSHVHQGGGQ
jgi:hypothetical protein